MLRPFIFPLIALFWVIMNALLWRSEMGSGTGGGSTVRPEVVWNRILTAPDDSSLQILHRGNRIGYCRWLAQIQEEETPAREPAPDPEADETLEGRVRRVSGYTLDFDGNFMVGEVTQRVRFAWHAEFSTNRVWRKMTLKVHYRPYQWEIRADAAREQLEFRMQGDGTRLERTFTFAELQRPEALLATLGLPAGYAWMGEWARTLGGFGALGALGGIAATGSGLPAPQDLTLGLQWQARTDWMKLGHSRLRVHRLEARLLDRYETRVEISRVGEILRVELPEGLVLVNEALSAF